MGENNRRLQVKYEEKPCYDIVIEDHFKNIGKELSLLDCQERKVCIVTDSNVGHEYALILAEFLKDCVKEVIQFTFPAGEKNKNLITVNELYEHLIQASFDRNDILIALGGGVVGDLTGFTAATYLRGIRFIQVPTSLLAMVDSSIGGKTGVDFLAYKNMVGAFYMPKNVYINIETLHTLKEKEFFSGMGEIIKHGLILDKAYYHWIKNNISGIKVREPETLKQMIYQSCVIKKNVVESDPKEKGERALLNFGHTIGHAVEKLMGLTLLHGECVGIGMIAASYISFKRGYISNEEFNDVEETIESFGLPVRVKGIKPEEVIQVASKDKKMDAGKIKFILLKHIGNAYIDTTVSADEMTEAVKYLLS